MSARLDSLMAELHSAAARLRAEGLDADEAAGLVERCAELAADVGAELDRQRRALGSAPDPAGGQQELL